MSARIRSFALAAGLLAMVTPAPFAQDVVAANRKAQEARLLERIDAMKADPQSLFFAVSTKAPAEQDAFAQRTIQQIQELSKTEGFDSPDYDRIVELAASLLRTAPDVPLVQMVHWNIHTLYLIQENTEAARAALESYLFKYPNDDEFRLREARDKLCVFATKREDWDAALYYAARILDEQPESWAHVLTKARALIRLGHQGMAVPLLERIIENAAGTVQYNLAVDELETLRTGRPGEPADKPPTRDDPPAGKVPPKAAETSGPGLSPGELEAYRESMQRIREIATALEVSFLDDMTYPKTLEGLVPTFLRELKPDAWGRAVRYQVDGDRYVLGSAGSDGAFDGFDQQPRAVDEPGVDIVFSDGGFLVCPRALRDPAPPPV